MNFQGCRHPPTLTSPNGRPGFQKRKRRSNWSKKGSTSAEGEAQVQHGHLAVENKVRL